MTMTLDEIIAKTERLAQESESGGGVNKSLELALAPHRKKFFDAHEHLNMLLGDKMSVHPSQTNVADDELA